MRKLVTLAVVLLVGAAVTAGAQQTGQPAQQPAAAQAQPAAPPAAGKPESLQDRASYIIGFNLGRSLTTNDVKVNADLIIKGLRDALGNTPSVLSEAEMNETMQTFQQQVQQQQEAKRKAAGDKNKAEGEAFLAKNKERKEVKTTASGLQYEVLTEGTGPSPKATDTVTVHYKGTSIDGTVFDSSYPRGEPATFPLNRVIPGWSEGVQLMKAGSKYKFYVPAALGYGEQGAPGGVIGPNETLIFEVELLSIGQPEPPAPAEQPPTEQKPPGR
jgi:FKBP-type peptidyl-prolyl cis-trans isomerase